MAKIISMERETTEGEKETVYPRTYALAVFLNNGETSVLDTVGSDWSANDKNLKTCSDDIGTLISNIETLTSKLETAQSNIEALTSRVSSLEQSKS